MINTAKSVAKQLIRAGHGMTAVLDHRFMKADIELSSPPIFIIGAPRSGTTLLYQVMMTAFDFSYLPNISNRWYMCPITAADVGKRLCRPYVSSFSSTHGYENGCMAPSEAGNVWNRWFPYEKREGFNYTPAGWLSDRARQEIHHLVAHISRLFGAPFITKNVKMSVRIQALDEIFPNALFLCISREPFDVAASLLRIRREKKKSWWSVLPKEFEQIVDMADVEQVCHQVYYTEQNIAADLRAIPPGNYLSFSYEYLCQNPHALLDEIAGLFANHGIKHLPHHSGIPDSFQLARARSGGMFTRDEEARMRHVLDSLYGAA